MIDNCQICFQGLDLDSEKTVNCPSCSLPFHYLHLAAWNLTESHCPVCKEPLDESLREMLMPRTLEEREKLTMVKYEIFPKAGQTSLEKWNRIQRYLPLILVGMILLFVLLGSLIELIFY